MVWIPPESAMESVTLGALTSTSPKEPFGAVCSIDGRWIKAKQLLRGGTVAAFANNAPCSPVAIPALCRVISAAMRLSRTTLCQSTMGAGARQE